MDRLDGTERRGNHVDLRRKGGYAGPNARVTHNHSHPKSQRESSSENTDDDNNTTMLLNPHRRGIVAWIFPQHNNYINKLNQPLAAACIICDVGRDASYPCLPQKIPELWVGADQLEFLVRGPVTGNGERGF